MFALSAPVWSGPWATLAAELFCRGGAFLAVALGAHFALGRKRAVVQSVVWNACLIGLLLLPLSLWSAPRLTVWIPAPSAAPAASAPAIAPQAPISPRSAGLLPRPRVIPDVPAAVPAAPPAVTARADSTASRPISLAAVFVACYLAGLALLLLRLAVAIATVERLRRSATTVNNPRWAQALSRFRGQLAIEQPVSLLASTDVSVPIVMGWFRPAIVLPEPLLIQASDSAIDAVLLHELAHISRADYAWNLVRKLVQALYWPQPLVWMLGPVTSAARELACDALCVHTLGSAVYRDCLLEVAGGLVRKREPAIGMAMARATQLKQRLERIRSTAGLPRCRSPRVVRVLCSGAILAVAATLGMIHVARSSAGETQEPARASSGTENETSRADTPAEIVVEVVAGDTGKPIANPQARLSIDDHRPLVAGDRDGKIRVDLRSRRFPNRVSIDVWADGFVQQQHVLFVTRNGKDEAVREKTITLFPATETLGGKVVDEQGDPIVGARVEVSGKLGPNGRQAREELAYEVGTRTDAKGEWRLRCFRNMVYANLSLFHPDYLSEYGWHDRPHGDGVHAAAMKPLRDFTDVQVMARGVRLSGRVVDPQGKPIAGALVCWFEAAQLGPVSDEDLDRTTTDAEGRYELPHVRPTRVVILATAKGHAPSQLLMTAERSTSDLQITLAPPSVLSGQVVDPRGRPIEGAVVVVRTWKGNPWPSLRFWTGRDGRFRWDDAPSEPVVLAVGAAGYETKFGETVRAGIPANFKLARKITLAGKVIDARTKAPIEQAEASLGEPDGQGGWRWRFAERVTVANARLEARIDPDQHPRFRIQIRAMGYDVYESPILDANHDQLAYNVSMIRHDTPTEAVLEGTALRPDGKPLANAQVAIAYPIPMGTAADHPMLVIANGRINATPEQAVATTDAEGRFKLTRDPDPRGRYFSVVVAHPDFFGRASRKAFEAKPVVATAPWGRIEGVARAGAGVVGHATIQYQTDALRFLDTPYLDDSRETTTDNEGRFAFEHVMPGDVRVARAFGTRLDRPHWRTSGTLVTVVPGETSKVVVGGNGRPIVAHIALPDGFDPRGDYIKNSNFQIESVQPLIPYPESMAQRWDEAASQWAHKWWASPEGHAYRQKSYTFRQYGLDRDGVLRVADVPPGDYELRLIYSADRFVGGPPTPDRVAHLSLKFTVPEGDSGHERDPVDLGLLRPEPRRKQPSPTRAGL